MFGLNKGRLKWSTHGSLLLNHHLDKKMDECVADPPDNTNVRDIEGKLINKLRANGSFANGSIGPKPKVEVSVTENANSISSIPKPTVNITQNIPPLFVKSSQARQSRFTLIDTYSMTATAF